MFSKACEYGIRAVLFISTKSSDSERVRIGEIASEIMAPEAFTAKVLQKLVKRQIIESSTGPRGGFFIAPENLENIKLIQIVDAIDGDKILKGCGLGLPECDNKHPCPVHHQFKEIRKGLVDMLENTSLYEMASDVEEGVTFLKY